MKAIGSILLHDGQLLERALAYASFWMYRCLTDHSCSDSLPSSETLWPSLPKRVVDVAGFDQGRVKLVEGNGMRSPYGALSYRWRENGVRTTESSLSAFHTEIPLNLLQSQIYDAFLIANRLGIRYVWVDALVSNPNENPLINAVLISPVHSPK